MVTGASSGIGWQTAVRLAERGVRLCVTARRADALARLAGELERRGAECLVVPGDVTVDADVARVVERCIERYGRVDVLVNDAAVQAYAPFERYRMEEIERIFDVTCFGYMRFARAVLPRFRFQGEGHLINVLSMLALGAAPLLSAYTAAKHALWGWSESLRLELHGSGISVSNVMAPSVSTPMFDHAPTVLGLAPAPVPPTYDADVVARAVVKVAMRPNNFEVPVFLQGRLILLLNAVAPWVGDAILGRWGAKLQTRNQPIDRPRGNLFEPTAEGVGPRGSVPPTARWKRWAATAAIVGVAGAAAAGAVEAARQARRLAA